jgi:hypothetical protein
MIIESGSTQPASGAIDQIAALLAGDEQEEQQEPTGTEPETEGQQATPEGDQDEGDEGDTPEREEGDEGEGDDEQVTWSKALGVDESQLVLADDGTVKGVVVKVDGEVSTVGLKDLIAGYQTNKYVTQKSQALSAERKTFDEQREQVVALYKEKLTAVSGLTDALTNALTADYQGVNWEKLRVENPGEYAAAQADFQRRQQQIQQIMEAVKTETSAAEQRKAEEMQQQQTAFLKAQFEKVIANNPQWSDHDKMRTDLSELSNVLQAAYGISPEEFAMVSDARHIEILKDAAAYNKGKTVAKQKMADKPTFQSTRSKPNKPMDKVTQLVLSARKAKGAKQRDLQSAAVAALLMGE